MGKKSGAHRRSIERLRYKREVVLGSYALGRCLTKRSKDIMDAQIMSMWLQHTWECFSDDCFGCEQVVDQEE